MPYFHELPDWPHFSWNQEGISALLLRATGRQQRLQGRLEGMGQDLRQEAVAAAATLEVVKSSEIEGESLNRDQVRGSINRRLGIQSSVRRAPDHNVDGVVQMILDATEHHDRPLTKERLLD